MKKHHRLLPFIFGAAALFAASFVSAERYEGALRPEIRTDQDEINSGELPFTEIFYRGLHLYSNRYTRMDGYGEAPDGPRNSTHKLLGNSESLYLRFNGLDAQACFECHAQLGFKDYGYMSMPKEPGVIGSSAGISASIFLFPDLDDMSTGIIRNPPHNFGLGYVQRLAEEMSFKLLEIRDQAIEEAQTMGQSRTKFLVAKGVDFGKITANSDGTVDMSEVVGVSEDLVVRPFQFKGIASTLRNFITNALNFHFSVQPKETLERGIIPNDNPNGTLEGDIEHEILEGEVTAIAGFLAANRPPMVDMHGMEEASVLRGREVFGEIGCTTCHVPALKIFDSRVTIIDPRMITEMQRERERENPGFVSIRQKMRPDYIALTMPELDSEFLPTVVQYDWMKNREKFASVVADERSLSGERPPGLTIDLNADFLPDEALPRLPYNSDGSIDVPLFSDLKRHRMGDNLADTMAEPTDVVGIDVQPPFFVTRPLWGVADTAPWLHDGRATTLQDAILFHEGPNSEANPVIESYRGLTETDRDALIDFLFSLRARPMSHSAEPTIHRQGWVIR